MWNLFLYTCKMKHTRKINSKIAKQLFLLNIKVLDIIPMTEKSKKKNQIYIYNCWLIKKWLLVSCSYYHRRPLRYSCLNCLGHWVKFVFSHLLYKNYSTIIIDFQDFNFMFEHLTLSNHKQSLYHVTNHNISISTLNYYPC